MNGDVWNALGAIGQVGGVVALLVVYRIEANQTQLIERREIYQRLELASVDLFRFEQANPDLFSHLWLNAVPIQAGALEYLQLRQYCCQILNLFEMAVSFRSDGIITVEVFETWIVWMFELAERPLFRTLWSGGLATNYLAELRVILDKAIALQSEYERDIALSRLYEYVKENKRVVGFRRFLRSSS